MANTPPDPVVNEPPLSFWEENWDKVISVIISTVIALIVGYFSGVMAIRSEVAKVRERVTALETKVTVLLEPRANTVEDHAKKFVTIEEQIKSIESRNDLAAATAKLFEAELEKNRGATLAELRKLLDAN